MKRRHAVLAAAVLAAAIIWYLFPTRDRLQPGPFKPSLTRGDVMPVADYRLTGPYTHENLAVFLVHGRDALPGKSFLTLKEALEQKKAVVHETGTVNTLSIEYVGDDEELYVQSGDIVKGGKQDRTFPYDVILAPNSGQVPINSFCVEQGRWAKRGEESASFFSSSASGLATAELKRAAKSPKESSQGAVWQNVANTQQRLGKKLGGTVRSDQSASSLQLTLESPAVRTAIEPYLGRLGPTPAGQDDVVGYVAVVNGKVISADVYAASTLFRKVWPKLIEGSAIEAFIEAEPGSSFEPIGEEAVRAVLAAVEAADPDDEAVTERTHTQIRSTPAGMLFDTCDRARNNLVIHRSFLAR